MSNSVHLLNTHRILVFLFVYQIVLYKHLKFLDYNTPQFLLNFQNIELDRQDVSLVLQQVTEKKLRFFTRFETINPVKRYKLNRFSLCLMYFIDLRNQRRWLLTPIYYSYHDEERPYFCFINSNFAGHNIRRNPYIYTYIRVIYLLS